jgi:hypothetical protein
MGKILCFLLNQEHVYPSLSHNIGRKCAYWAACSPLAAFAQYAYRFQLVTAEMGIFSKGLLCLGILISRMGLAAVLTLSSQLATLAVQTSFHLVQAPVQAMHLHQLTTAAAMGMRAHRASILPGQMILAGDIRRVVQSHLVGATHPTILVLRAFIRRIAAMTRGFLVRAQENRASLALPAGILEVSSGQTTTPGAVAAAVIVVVSLSVISELST